ncbi:MAG: metal-dependent hydrolase [Methanobacteriaceae archaeon]|nr:metal-dependent hydrolase [Methanobacteriaceae archaeon]
MKIKYYGHAAFKIVTNDGLQILIDPFISGNPQCQVPLEEISTDIILVTHGHQDHLGDTLEIAHKTGAQTIATAEIATFVEKQGFEAVAMNKGGTVVIGDVSITMTDAKHSSSIETAEGPEYAGEPGGFIIKLEDGKKIFHAGDTSLFGDMKTIIGDLYKPDISLLPIGDKFTMGPEEASIAAGWLQSRIIIPMYYNTFPEIEQDPEFFAKITEEENIGTKVVILNSEGEYIEE